MPAHTLGAASTLLQNGEMRRFELDGKAVVVARVEDQYHAFRASCTHYGGPLNEGVLKGHTVMCPWHHACFDIRTGARTEPPALSDLPTFSLRIEDGNVVVDVDQPGAKPATPQRESDSRTFVIVGGGAAGEAAAEELRREGFTGNIVLLSASPLLPIDRPNVSKDYLNGHARPEWMPLRGAGWYPDRNIVLRLNETVTGVDTPNRRVMLASGESLAFDGLLLATGGTPRTLNIPGHDLSNIFLLREQPDADRIIQSVGEGSGKRAVIIGASFIGMEAASSLASRGVQITVVGMEALPFERIFGAEIGRLFQREHEANGIQFRLSSGIERFVSDDGRVTGVELKGGEVLPADFVVVGVGVTPATAFLADSGLALGERDKSVLVNDQLQASVPEVYAAGDIARFTDKTGGRVRIEHWRLAQQHGMIAAHNLLDKDDGMTHHVPFFWTTQWDLTVSYVGHAEAWDEIVYRGTLDAKDFIAFYVQGGKLLAAAGAGRDRELCAIEFMLRDDVPLSVEQMRDEGFDLVAHSQQ
ncbi:MAG: FAD-dependent oxidoreductase [bacterium]|nr:FAD-dependent oxidoreductase [bacterium]